MPEVNGVSIPFLPAGGIDGLHSKNIKFQRENSPSSSSFNDVFRSEIDKLKFSGHAQSRIESRDLKLSEEELHRLNGAIDKARDKGSNESLVLMDDKAFIVSVANKTVITALSKDKLDANVITNIDSAVFA